MYQTRMTISQSRTDTRAASRLKIRRTIAADRPSVANLEIDEAVVYHQV